MGGAMTRIAIFGCGGHAKVVKDVIDSTDGQALCFVDVSPPVTNFAGLEVIAEEDFFRNVTEFDAVCIAVGENTDRRRIHREILSKARDLLFPAFIHSSAIIAKTARILEGSVVMPGVIVNADTTVGRFCIVNTRSVIEHDCVMGDFSSVGPAASVGGNCKIGRDCLIGIGASVKHGISVGENTLVAGGAMVTGNLDGDSVYAGVPARLMKRRGPGEKMLT